MNKTASDTPKVGQNPQFLTHLTSKCAWRHNAVLFFPIWTSKSVPRPTCFNTFDFQICFAPQRRALFEHLNFQKWSDHMVFWHFLLRNVLRATTTCTFSTSPLPKVVRTRCVLYILTCTCASRHNDVPFFIFHLAGRLHTCRFSKPTFFRPSGATKHWKNTGFRPFPTFSRTSIFSLSDPLPSDFLHVRVSSWLCFNPSIHFVGFLASKLPSAKR